MPVTEVEQRYELFSAPGKLRLLGYGDRAIMGSFDQAWRDPTSPPPDILATRKDRWKYGFILNLEQAVTADIGVFSRLGWTDGQGEAFTYTDMDRTASAGASVKGTGWGRPGDVIGLGGAINGLSTAHRRFLAAGGIGTVTVGDGALNYGPERLIEAYCSFRIIEPLSFTFDYQYFVNPAYNRDRGPVSIFAVRLHFEQ